MKNSSVSILENAEKIVVVRTDRLGDMVLTLPLCRVLKENYPNAEINLIARTYVAPLVENLNCFDKIYYTDRYADGIFDIFKLKQFDAAFFPRPRFDEVRQASKNGVKLRIGSAYRWYSVLFNHKVKDHRKKSDFHEAEYNVRMLESVLGKSLKTELVSPLISDGVSKFVNNLMGQYGLIENQFIIIHPGSGGSSRELPPENFGAIAKFLSEETKYRVVITGSESESVNCVLVEASAPDSVNLCGKLSLENLIGLISKSKTLIANSTGVIHIGSALGKKVIGFYPNTPHLSQKRWGPFIQGALVFNPPFTENKKMIDDMSLIDIEDVIHKINDHLL